MRDWRNPKITRGIAHLVLPKQARLVLSAAELPLEETVTGILERHITRGLADSQARAANFIAVKSDRVSGVCGQLLGDAPELVKLSQKVARRLYEVTIKDERISDAALAVLLCEAKGDQGAAERFLTLLKLDPSDALRPVEEKDTKGRQIIRLAIATDILPTKGERVQKAAFIRDEEPAAEYRILLVDRQTEQPAARFFTTDFLEAEFALDSVERTNRLHRSLQRARNDVAPELKAQDLAALDQVIAGAQVAARVNVDDLVTSLPVDEPVRGRIDEIVSESLPDREFDLDPEVARRLVRRRTFRADNGLRLSVPAEFFREMVDVKDIPGTKPRRRRVTIETQTWEEQ
jgi:37-kD nucleoid-associated bacterial protein